MKPDLSEIKPVAWCVSVSGMYVYGGYKYVKRERDEYEADCWSGPNPDPDTPHEDPEPVYDQSALEAAHEAGRRAGLEAAIALVDALGKKAERASHGWDSRSQGYAACCGEVGGMGTVKHEIGKLLEQKP